MSEASPILDAEHPWPGLFPYGEDAHAFFNGRERETTDLLRLVRRNELTLLYGQSGLGKSSLLRAGLFPALRNEEYLPVYLRLDFRNQSLGLREQAWGLLKAAMSAAKIDARLPRDNESLWEYFHATDVELWDSENRNITPVLVFDQFEEIVQASEERTQLVRLNAFMEELADLIENRIPLDVTRRLEHDPDIVSTLDFNARRFRCILSFREDFLPDLEQWFSRNGLSTSSRLRVVKMGEEQALAAIVKTGGCLVDREVAHHIVSFISAAASGRTERSVEIEPALLSVACFELNNRRLAQRAPNITKNLLEGAQDEIIAEFYQRSVSDLDISVQTFIERELLTESGYRDSCALDDAVQRHGIAREVILKLVERRVLRLEERFSVLRVELTHDVLTAVVREQRDQRQALIAQEQQRQREATRAKRTRLLFSVGGGLFGLAATLVIVFFNLFRQADAEKQRAIETQSTLFLARANDSLDNNIPSEPNQYLAQALALNPNNEGAVARMASLVTQRTFARKVWQKEFGSAAESIGNAVVLDGGGFAFPSSLNQWRTARPVNLTPSPGLQETCATSTPVKSKDNSRVSISFEPKPRSPSAGQARISDAEVDLAAAAAPSSVNGKPALSCPPAPPGTASAKDYRLVRAVEPSTGALWLVDAGKLVRRLPEEGLDEVILDIKELGDVSKVVPSRDGKAALVVSDDLSLILVANGSKPSRSYASSVVRTQSSAKATQADAITNVLFDDASLLALLRTAGGRCELRELASGKTLWTRTCGDVQAFVPGKPWVVMSDHHSRPIAQNDGGAVRLETVAIADGKSIGMVRQQLGVNHIAFSPASDLVVVASQDRTAKIFELPSLSQVGSPLMHEGAVVEAHFRTSDASQVVTASFDGAARVWDWRDGKLVLEPMLHPGPVLFARPVLDGKFVMTLADDRQLRLWRLIGQNDVARPAWPRVSRPVLSPNGQKLAHVAEAGPEGKDTIMLSNVANVPRKEGPLIDSLSLYKARGAVKSLHFSDDGQLIAVVGKQSSLAVVRVADGVEERLLSFPQPLETATFSPDRSLLLVHFADDSFSTVDMLTGLASGLPVKLREPTLAFGISIDGKWLSVATGAQLQIFDLRTGYLVDRIAPGGIVSAAIHPSRAEIVYSTRQGIYFWRPTINARGIKKQRGAKTNESDRAAREFAEGEGAFVPSKKLLVNLRYTGDGSAIAAYSIDGLASTWDTQTLVQGPSLRHSSTIVTMEMSRDSRWLTTTTLDGLARIWDYRSGQLMADPIRLQDRGLEFKILGTGTWGLIQVPKSSQSAGPAGGDSSVIPASEGSMHAFEIRMLGLGFQGALPDWFVPTTASLAGSMIEGLKTSPLANRKEQSASGWWEQWLIFVSEKMPRGLNEKN